jgi:hypothetical protein
MKTKIYVLCEPDGEIRYVGKTSLGLNQRLGLHLSCARCGSMDYRCNWIRRVLREGYLPLIRFVGEVEGDGNLEEIAWIAYGRQEGWRLVNITDGGEGARGWRASPETRQKMRKPKSAKHRFRISQSNLGRKPSVETRLKMSKAKQ